MEFENNNFLQNLERPPNINNLSISNIIQIVLMIILGCWSGYNLYLQFNPFKLTISFVLQVFIYGLLFCGLIFGFYGMLSEKNVRMKTGFLCFWVGCITLLIKVIIGIFYEGINFRCLFELLLSLFLGFVILKQIQHI